MAQDPEVPVISTLTLRLFARLIARRRFRRHFRSVMVQRLAHLRDARGPLIVYGNHSSWWDPLLMMVMARIAMPNRHHYAPMDAAALARYPLLRKLGIFPVEMTTARGAAMFLRTSTAVLRSGGVLWLTPQGRFADPRAWPLGFKPGIGALAIRMPGVPLLPMAVEYTFWDERLPEALVRFGEAQFANAKNSAAEATTHLEQVLAAEMLELQACSVARDASAFEVAIRGGRGMGGVYGAARRMRALLLGKQLQPDHTPRV